jgi:hypothetical protein
MQYRKGQRVTLVHTDDPHTQLRPGEHGTVLRHDTTTDTIHIAWDSGSRLAMCPEAGDRIRLLDHEQGSRGGEAQDGPQLPRYLLQVAADLGFTLEPDLDQWVQACAEDPTPVLSLLTTGLRHALNAYTYTLASTSHELLRQREPQDDPAQVAADAPRLAALDRHLTDLTGRLTHTGAAFRLRLRAHAHGGSGLVRPNPTR